MLLYIYMRYCFFCSLLNFLIFRMFFLFSFSVFFFPVFIDKKEESQVYRYDNSSTIMAHSRAFKKNKSGCGGTVSAAINLLRAVVLPCRLSHRSKEI